MNAHMAKAEAIAARDVPALTAALRAELREGASNIPAELKQHKAWVCWRAPVIAPTGKVSKVPLYPVSGRNRKGAQGGPDDLQNLGTWTQAAAAFNKDDTIAGVGFAMLPDFGIVAFDGDHCVADGAIRADVAKLANRTYCEISPSDTGVRALWMGSASDGKNHVEGFELFHAKGFVTITGKQVPTAHPASGAAPLPVLDEPLRAELERLTRPASASSAASKESDRVAGPVDDLGRMAALHGATAETIAELGAALAGMKAGRADDRERWIEVLQALASLKETAFGAEAYQLARDFSEQSDKFDPDDFELKWDGMAPSRITYKSIFTWAADDGWANPRAGAPAEVVTAEALANAPAAAPGAPRRFPIVPASEFRKRAPMTWLIKGVLPKAGLCLLFGPSGSGKTFATLDMVVAVARGVEWRGRKVKQGKVVYICAEGAGGFRDRLDAYALHHSLDDLPISIMGAAPNFLLSKDIEAVVAELALLGALDVIVVDTAARVMPGGNENSSDDMGRVIAHCDALHRATGALVILVTHTGKDENAGARGWSGQKAAADVQIRVSRAGDYRALTIEKMKDGAGEGAEFGFKLNTVTISQDEDGDDITSCVLEHTATVPKAEQKKEPKGANQIIVLNTLKKSIELTGEGMSDNDLAEAAANELAHNPSGKRDTRRQKCMEAINALKAANRIVTEKGLLVPT